MLNIFVNYSWRANSSWRNWLLEMEQHSEGWQWRNFFISYLCELFFSPCCSL